MKNRNLYAFILALAPFIFSSCGLLPGNPKSNQRNRESVRLDASGTGHEIPKPDKESFTEPVLTLAATAIVKGVSYALKEEAKSYTSSWGAAKNGEQFLSTTGQITIARDVTIKDQRELAGLVTIKRYDGTSPASFYGLDSIQINYPRTKIPPAAETVDVGILVEVDLLGKLKSKQAVKAAFVVKGVKLGHYYTRAELEKKVGDASKLYTQWFSNTPFTSAELISNAPYTITATVSESHDFGKKLSKAASTVDDFKDPVVAVIVDLTKEDPPAEAAEDENAEDTPEEGGN